MGRVCARSQHLRQDGPLLERLALLCVRSSVRYRTVVNPNLNKYCCMMDNTNVSDEATSPVPTLIPMPVDIRSLALSVLAVIATVFAMAWTKAIVVPLLMGLMVSYALTPVVNRLARWHVPRVVGAGLVMGAIVFAFAWGGWSLRDEAVSFVDSLPSLSHNLRQKLKFPRSTPVDTIAKVQQAATEISKAAQESVAPGVPTQRVTAEHPAVNIQGYLWSGTMGLIALLGQIAIVMLVAFFLLASGNNFRRKMVKLAGPKLSKKRITIKALDEVTEQIQRYLLVQIATSAVLGFLTWMVFLWFGMHSAGVWGVVAGITNLIPYFGAAIIAVGSTAMGLVQFDTVSQALMVGFSTLAIHSVIGNLVAPWLTGRASRTNPLSVFIAVLVFGWLWGPAGLILGVPILIVVKAVCDRVDELKPIGDFLGPGGRDT